MATLSQQSGSRAPSSLGLGEQVSDGQLLPVTRKQRVTPNGIDEVPELKGDMSGWFEVRIDGPKRHHYRLFCLLDYEAKGKETPLLVVVDGRDKPFRTTLSDADYAAVRSMGEEYLKRNPRSIG